MPRIVPEFPAIRDTFLVSLLTGRHTADHGILSNQMFFKATQNITNLTQTLPWEHVKSLGTIWVSQGQLKFYLDSRAGVQMKL